MTLQVQYCVDATHLLQGITFFSIPGFGEWFHLCLCNWMGW